MEIVINNKELIDNNLNDIVKQTIGRLIDQLSNLSLISLQYIIIPEDFGGELIQFQKERGLSEGYTNNGFGVAMGKVLTYIEDGIRRSTIFFDPRVIITLFDEVKSQNAVHLMHHEFCHVHDDYKKYVAFGVTNPEEIFFGTPDRTRQVAYAHADMIWSEYIATRLSAGSKPSDHDMYIDSVFQLLPKTEEECKEAIFLYRIEDDVGKLFGEIQLTTSLFLKVSAYFIGYCHGLNYEPPQEFLNIITEYHYLDGVWEELSPVLHHLHDSYSSWSDIHVFEDLANIVIKLWGQLGIYPRNEDGQLFVSVP